MNKPILLLLVIISFVYSRETTNDTITARTKLKIETIIETTSPKHFLSIENGSYEVKMFNYDSAGVDSARASSVADTALHTPDSVRASHVSDTCLSSITADSTRASHVADTALNTPDSVRASHASDTALNTPDSVRASHVSDTALHTPDSVRVSLTSGISEISKVSLYADTAGYAHITGAVDSSRAAWKADSSGFADSSRASYVSDTALNTPDSVGKSDSSNYAYDAEHTDSADIAADAHLIGGHDTTWIDTVGDGAQNELFLKLDQTTPQTVDNGVPVIINGLTIGTETQNTFVDSETVTTDNIRVNTTTQLALVDVWSSASDFPSYQTSVNANPIPGVMGRSANGTIAVPTAIAANKFLCAIAGRGYNGSDFSGLSNGVIAIKSGETFTPTKSGTFITFETTAVGQAARTEKVRINDKGNVGIGKFTGVAEKLEVAGNIAHTDDNQYDYFGAAKDGGITHDGNNMIYNSRLIGTGDHHFLEGLIYAENIPESGRDTVLIDSAGYFKKRYCPIISAGLDDYLKLDQTTPQTVSNGVPIFSSGLSINKSTFENWNSQYGTIQLGGNSAILGTIAEGATSRFFMTDNAYFTPSGWYRVSTDETSLIGLLDGSIRFYTNGSGNQDELFTPTERVRFNSDGVVAILTTPPTSNGTILTYNEDTVSVSDFTVTQILDTLNVPTICRNFTNGHLIRTNIPNDYDSCNIVLTWERINQNVGPGVVKISATYKQAGGFAVGNCGAVDLSRYFTHLIQDSIFVSYGDDGNIFFWCKETPVFYPTANNTSRFSIWCDRQSASITSVKDTILNTGPPISPYKISEAVNINTFNSYLLHRFIQQGYNSEPFYVTQAASDGIMFIGMSDVDGNVVTDSGPHIKVIGTTFGGTGDGDMEIYAGTDGSIYVQPDAPGTFNIRGNASLILDPNGGYYEAGDSALVVTAEGNYSNIFSNLIPLRLNGSTNGEGIGIKISNDSVWVNGVLVEGIQDTNYRAEGTSNMIAAYDDGFSGGINLHQVMQMEYVPDGYDQMRNSLDTYVFRPFNATSWFRPWLGFTPSPDGSSDISWGFRHDDNGGMVITYTDSGSVYDSQDSAICLDDTVAVRFTKDTTFILNNLKVSGDFAVPCSLYDGATLRQAGTAKVKTVAGVCHITLPYLTGTVTAATSTYIKFPNGTIPAPALNVAVVSVAVNFGGVVFLGMAEITNTSSSQIRLKSATGVNFGAGTLITVYPDFSFQVAE